VSGRTDAAEPSSCQSAPLDPSASRSISISRTAWVGSARHSDSPARRDRVLGVTASSRSAALAAGKGNRRWRSFRATAGPMPRLDASREPAALRRCARLKTLCDGGGPDSARAALGAGSRLGRGPAGGPAGSYGPSRRAAIATAFLTFQGPACRAIRSRPSRPMARPIVLVAFYRAFSPHPTPIRSNRPDRRTRPPRHQADLVLF